MTPSCLITRFDGVILSQEWKNALWDKFVMAAPRLRTLNRICVGTITGDYPNTFVKVEFAPDSLQNFTRPTPRKASEHQGLRRHAAQPDFPAWRQVKVDA